MDDNINLSYTLFPDIDNKADEKKLFKIPDVADKHAAAYWSKCLEIIRDNVDKQVFTTWFEPIKAHKWENSKLTILVPSQWFFEWIEAHYFDLLQKTIKRVLGEFASLEYEVVVEEKKNTLDSRTIKLPGLRYPTTTHQSLSASAQPFNTNLHPRYIFDNYVVGDSNQLAYSAAVAVSQNPGGTKFNPLFIFGGTGLGKTHLAQAIGNSIVRKDPKARVLYTNSERFYIEFVSAIQNNKIHEFANIYREVDALIVDDIQFLAGKGKTQDHFFHTFNDLYQAGKQLIFTSDKSPRDLVELDARLISRFQWGLIADIQLPDFETRMAIIKRKSEDEGTDIPIDVLEFLAKNITSSVRELEGALIGLLAKVTFDNRPLSLEVANEVVFGTNLKSAGTISMGDIKQAVSEKFEVEIKLMESKTRKHEITLARQMAIYIAKQLTELSLKQIGASFGGRDHSTVLHSCRAIEDYLATDSSVKNAYQNIMKKLKS